MKLRQMILAEHSKAQTEKIVRWVGNSQARFDELFNLFLNDEYRVIQRAAWPLSYCAIRYPELVKKHFRKLVVNLERPDLPDAVKRNTVRLLGHVTIPKTFHGRILNICFGYISSPAEPAAVKAFSLGILGRLSKEYPEIVPEIKLIIEERWDHESAAFRSRARNFLREK